MPRKEIVAVINVANGVMGQNTSKWKREDVKNSYHEIRD